MMDPDDIEIESIIRLGSQAEGEYNVIEEHEETEVDDEMEPDANLSKPYIGMEFDTVDAAYNFYNAYALRIGFGIRKSISHKSAKDDSIIDRKFVCNKSGFYIPKTSSDDKGKEVVRRGTTMVGCGAMIRVKVTQNNIWKVTHFVEEHTNHDLTSPTKTSEHRSHKKAHLDPVVRSLMTQFKEKGMQNRDIARAIEAYVHHQKISSQHVHDHVRKDRRKNLGQNCHLLIRHLKEKQKTESGFYFDFDLDEENTFQRVFWADRRSQIDYGKFSDVIIFDVTYRTNSLSLPFAPITGINHHRQSILLGCALLPDEKEDTFVWLFSQWLKCMGGRTPGAIITDQDPAIGNAIARVFPATRHRFCDWHLEKNRGEHLHHLEKKYGSDFRPDYERLISSKSILEAERHWEEFMKKYPMGEKTWLPKLWAQRGSWVRCYLKNIFLARCRSSQRAESINAFFDGYVNARTPVNEFVIQYERAVSSRRQMELTADFQTINHQPPLLTEWKLEETARKHYTKATFALFKEELRVSKEMWHVQLEAPEENVRKYKVGRYKKSQDEWRVVTFDSSVESVVSCECTQFEREGILCRHALNIMWLEHVVDLPECYILSRWTIGARHRTLDHSQETEADVGCEEVSPQMYFNLQNLWNVVFKESCKSVDDYQDVHSFLSNKLEVLKSRNSDLSQVQPPNSLPSQSFNQIGSSMSLVGDSTCECSDNMIRDPSEPVRTKGKRRANDRWLGGMEASQKAQEKRSRHCRECGEVGHNNRTCHVLKAKEAAAKEAASKGI